MNTNKKSDQALPGRRDFIRTVAQMASASSTLLMTPVTGMARINGAQKSVPTVRGVIALIIKDIPGAPFKDTVDTLKSGSMDQPVTGVVTTMFATVEVIEKAAALGANFIIVHEPTFYNHQDATDWLKDDEVYKHKHSLLKKHNIAIWRCHDYIHSYSPDGVQMGVLTKLGWVDYAQKEDLRVITIPPMSLGAIISHVKSSLGISSVRVMGNLDQSCTRILLLPGAPGGRRQIEALQKIKPDLLIAGELSEWETSEYIRDDLYMGNKRGLIVLGHAVSEEPGMEWLAKWLQPKLPGITITHLVSENPFSFV